MPGKVAAEISWTRRDWALQVLGWGAWGFVGDARGARAAQSAEVENPDLGSFRVQGAKAGLVFGEAVSTAHYAGVGDASPTFREEALNLCENLGATFLAFFRSKGFDVAWPATRLVAVVLKDRASYEAFKGKEVSDVEGGYYNVRRNCLVIFDSRNGPGQDPAGQRRVNTFVLVHEAVHQLTFAMKLLSREADVPIALSEGMATQAELWTNARKEMGQVNRFRLNVLGARNEGPAWIPIQDLMANDEYFYKSETEQLAYAESWLLIHESLRTGAGRARLKAFLKASAARVKPGQRVEDFEASFGGLERLDRDLKRRASLLLGK